MDPRTFGIHGVDLRNRFVDLYGVVKSPASSGSTWGHPQTGSYLAQFEAVFLERFLLLRQIFVNCFNSKEMDEHLGTPTNRELSCPV